MWGWYAGDHDSSTWDISILPKQRSIRISYIANNGSEKMLVNEPGFLLLWDILWWRSRNLDGGVLLWCKVNVFFVLSSCRYVMFGCEMDNVAYYCRSHYVELNRLHSDSMSNVVTVGVLFGVMIGELVRDPACSPRPLTPLAFLLQFHT